MWRFGERPIGVALGIGIVALGLAGPASAEGVDNSVPILSDPQRVLDRPGVAGRPQVAFAWNKIAFSPNGKLLAGVGEAETKAAPVMRKAAPKGMGVGEPGPASPGHQYRVALWNTDTFELRQTVLNLGTSFGRTEVKFTRDGRNVVVRGLPEPKVDEADPRLANEADRRLAESLRRAQRGAVEPDGRLVFWQDGASRIALAPEADRAFVAVAPGHDNQGVVVVDRAGVREFKVENYGPQRVLQLASLALAPTVQVFLAPAALNGPTGTIVGRVPGGRIEVWDLQVKQRRFVVPVAADADPTSVPRVELSENGARVAVGHARRDGSTEVVVFDAADGSRKASVAVGGAGGLVDLDLSTDGRWLLTVAGGETRLWDAANGRALAILKTSESRMLSAAISPDNRRVATGSEDAVRLWDISRLTSPGTGADGGAVAAGGGANGVADPFQPAFVPSPAADSLFISAPCEVVATEDGRDQRRFVVRLAKDHVLWRRAPNGPAILVHADRGTVRTIKTRDGQSVWTFNTVTKAFQGPKLPGPKPPATISVAGREATPEQRSVLQVLALRRVVQIAIQEARFGDDPSELVELNAKIRERAEALRRRQETVPGLRELYEALPKFIDDVAREGNVQDNLILEYNQEIARLAKEQEKVMARRQANQLLGFAQMFLGAMPDQEIVEANGRRFLVDRGMANPEMFANGFRGMMSASMEAQQQMAMLKQAEAMSNTEKREAFLKSLQAQAEMVGRIRAREQEIGARLNVPEADRAGDDAPGDAAKQAKMLGTLLERMARQAEKERDRLGFDNPMIRCDLVSIQSRILFPDRTKQIEAWSQQAREMAGLVALVPTGPEFDLDRVELLSSASALALQAAMAEVGPGAWGSAFNPRAAEAVRFLDAALRIYAADPSGRLRDLRGVALLLSGRGTEALQEFLAIRELSSDSGRRRIHLAHILAAAGQLGAALDEIEVALVQLKYPEIVEVRRSEDFPRTSRRFKDLTELKFDIRPVGRNAFEVRNKSRFALTNATNVLRWGRAGTNQMGGPPILVDHSTYRVFDRLEPGEACTIQPGPKQPPLMRDRFGNLNARIAVYTKGQGTFADVVGK
jgi:WD40 repeat protein